MKEDFVQYVWQFGLFNQNELKTIQGDSVQILKSGELNHNSGPDFLNAKIKIGDILWFGNVEIHTNTSDWVLHKHDQDPAFNNIILHVVFNHNLSESPQNFPLVEIKDLVSTQLIQKYQKIDIAQGFIPCEKLYKTVDPFIRESFLLSQFIQKLNDKHISYQKELMFLKGDINQLLFNHIAYSFGLKINAQSFYLIAKSIPVKLISKYKSEPFIVESLIFGQAGLLTDVEDDYGKMLQSQYYFLKQKHNLTGLNKTILLYSRLRPYNFPTVRLAQFSAFISYFDSLYDILHLVESIDAFIKVIQKIKPSCYWKNHFILDKESKIANDKNLSIGFIHLLLINSVLPLKSYIDKNKPNFDIDLILKLYEELPAEKNSVIKEFKNLGAISDNARQSQSLLYIKKKLCDYKKCLNCSIGNQILKV